MAGACSGLEVWVVEKGVEGQEGLERAARMKRMARMPAVTMMSGLEASRRRDRSMLGLRKQYFQDEVYLNNASALSLCWTR